MINKTTVKTALFALTGTLFLVSGAVKAADATGTWTTEGGKSHVKISRCGENLCGNIVSLATPNDETGKPKTDHNNEDESKRTRPILGMQIVLGMAPNGDNFKGRLYNPEDGKTYTGYLKLTDDSHIEVKGCVMGILCKSQTWTRN